MTTPDLDHLDQLRAAATEGKWGRWWQTRLGTARREIGRVSTAADAALIVAAVNALPALVAKVREHDATCAGLDEDRVAACDALVAVQRERNELARALDAAEARGRADAATKIQTLAAEFEGRAIPWQGELADDFPLYAADRLRALAAELAPARRDDTTGDAR